MKKDIEIPIARNIQVVAIKEWDKNLLAQNWNVYLVNNRKDSITAVLVMSRGNSEDQKTSTLRHGLGDVAPNTTVKIELITEEVLGFTNEYLITFFAEDKLYERNFVFEPNRISEKKSVTIPNINAEGVIAK